MNKENVLYTLEFYTVLRLNKVTFAEACTRDSYIKYDKADPERNYVPSHI